MTDASPVICAYCGAESPTWTTFCIRCGVPRAGSPPPGFTGEPAGAPTAAQPVAAHALATGVPQAAQAAQPQQAQPQYGQPQYGQPQNLQPVGQSAFVPQQFGQQPLGHPGVPPGQFAAAAGQATRPAVFVRPGLATEFGGLEPAKTGRRLAAFTIDALVVFAVATVVLLLTSSVVLGLLALVELAVGLLVWEANRGKTIGNALLGIRTTKVESPRNAGPLRSTIRGLVVVGGSLVGVVGAWVIVASSAWDRGGRSQGWHDLAGRTVTVKLPAGKRTQTTDWQDVAAVTARAAKAAPITPAVATPAVTTVAAGVGGLAPDATAEAATVAPTSPQRAAPGFTSLTAPEPEVRPEATPLDEQRARAIEYISPTVSSSRLMVEEIDEDSFDDSDRMPPPSGPVQPETPQPEIPSVDRVTAMLFAFDTGQQQRVTIPGTGVIGRNPREFTPGDQLISIDDPAKSVSKSHLLFQVSGSSVQVLDHASTNGSEILDDEGHTTKLVANVWTTVEPGSRVRVGQRVFAISAVQEK